jgi:hypothetical protein
MSPAAAPSRRPPGQASNGTLSQVPRSTSPPRLLAEDHYYGPELSPNTICAEFPLSCDHNMEAQAYFRPVRDFGFATGRHGQSFVPGT